MKIYFNKGISRLSLILLIVSSVVILIGGYFTWQHFEKKPAKPPMISKVHPKPVATTTLGAQTPISKAPISKVSTTKTQQFTLTTKKLGTLCQGCTLLWQPRPVFTPNGKRLAYAIKKDDKQLVVLDGKKGKEYDRVSQITFSPDSQHFAYVAKRNNKWFVVLDGKEGEEYDWVGRLTFSPDSQQFAYVAERDGNEVVVLDGKEGKEYDGVSQITFSPNSNHFAYVAERDGNEVVVLDGKEKKEYEIISDLTFSPDSERLAYAVYDDRKSFVMIDYQEQGAYESVDDLTFSPDSQHFAYVAERNKKHFVVLDGKEGRVYDDVYALIFSPDSKHFTYKVYTNKGVMVVLDGKSGKRYEDVNGLIFSPDSKHLLYTAEKDGRYLVVLDGKAGEQYNKVDFPIFSPNSQHFAYVAVKGWEWFVVLDGKRGQGYDGIRNFSFSPDSQHLAYVAEKDGTWFVVLDGKEEGPYDEVFSPLRFSKDSHYLYFGAQIGNELWRIVVNSGDKKVVYGKAPISQPISQEQFVPPQTIEIGRATVKQWKTYERKIIGASMMYPPEGKLDQERQVSILFPSGYHVSFTVGKASHFQWEDIPTSDCHLDSEGYIDSKQRQVNINGSPYKIFWRGQHPDRLQCLLKPPDKKCYILTLSGKNVLSNQKAIKEFYAMISTFRLSNTANYLLANDRSSWSTYQDKQYGFSLSYPPTYQVISKSDLEKTDFWCQACDELMDDKKVVLRLVPRDADIFKGTDCGFSEIQVGVSTSTKDCIATQMPQLFTINWPEKKEINGVTFYRKVRYGGAGMGKAIYDRGFSTLYNSQCYEITLSKLGTADRGFYSDAAGIIELPPLCQQAYFQILSTFRFIK